MTVTSSGITSPKAALSQQHDDDHPPDREQGVAHGVGDRVAQPWHLALGRFAHHAERGRRGAGSGTNAEDQRRMKAEDKLGEQHADDERNGRGEDAPKEQTDAQLLQADDESWPGRDPHHGNEHVQPDGVHEPQRGFRNPAKGRASAAKPSEHDTGDERSARSGQRHRNPTDVDDECADQGADRDGKRDERNR
ncbi:hypothetical protein G6F63_013344 [Rhizopus arrhizus]|nr:hypothetical protein G6F63_013344 [Rhizopus arrhizus]